MEALFNPTTLQIIQKFEDLPNEMQTEFREYILSQEFNIMMMADSYKASHSFMMPDGLTEVYSYLESRGGDMPATVFFGLQYYIKKYLTGVQVTRPKLRKAKRFWDKHVGEGKFDVEGWQTIIDECDGKLPLEIKAVPEGSVIPVKNILMSIRNTHPRAYFLTNWVETLLMKIWATITIASNSRRLMQLLVKYGQETCDNIDHVKFQMHDFGYRGVSSEETAAVLGAAHLVMFLGTDTAAGVHMLQKYYGEEMAGFSIPASEHSVMCSHRISDTSTGEVNAMRQILTRYADGTVAIVSDTYNIYYACDTIFGKELKDLILSRDGKLVIRPDSGDPVKVLCGDPTCDDPGQLGDWTRKGVIRILADRFGATPNERGFMVLNSKIGVIQGDGIDYAMTQQILERLTDIGFAASNLNFGSGGGLLQKFDRDSMKFAIKATHAIVNGRHINLQKTPITDPGKNSKKGYLKLVYDYLYGAHGRSNEKCYQTVEMSVENADFSDDILRPIFLNGELLIDEKFETIRQRAAA